MDNNDNLIPIRTEIGILASNPIYKKFDLKETLDIDH